MTINQRATAKNAKNAMAHGVGRGWHGAEMRANQSKPSPRREHTADRDARVVVREACERESARHTTPSDHKHQSAHGEPGATTQSTSPLRGRGGVWRTA